MPSWGPDLVYKLISIAISISMDVINEMRISENIDDFQYHNRVSRHLFDIILGELYGTLVRNGKGKYETVTPEKQLLVGLSCLSNMQSMREVAHVFS